MMSYLMTTMTLSVEAFGTAFVFHGDSGDSGEQDADTRGSDSDFDSAYVGAKDNRLIKW